MENIYSLCTHDDQCLFRVFKRFRSLIIHHVIGRAETINYQQVNNLPSIRAQTQISIFHPLLLL